MRAGGQDDRARFVDVPFALVALPGIDAAAVGAPAMPHHFKMEVGGATQVGLEGQRLFLLVNAAQEPLNRQRPRPEFHGHVCVFKAARSEM